MSANAILPLIYDELRALAARYLAREGPDPILQPTALVHEAYLRLAAQTSAAVRGKSHFQAIAAEVMRRVLVDHARNKKAAKRGGDRTRVTLDTRHVVRAGAARLHEFDVVDFDDLLRTLAELDPRQARIVELRFFGGLTIPEVAETLGVSTSTVEKDWRFARAWIASQLRGDRCADRGG